MKNGKFKRFMAMVSCVLCMSLFTANVFAATNDAASDSNEAHVYGVDVENSGEPGQLLTSRAIAECGSGSHDMRAKGWGDIVNVDTGKTVVNNGSCSQCSKCYLVIVTQGEPGTGKSIRLLHYMAATRKVDLICDCNSSVREKYLVYIKVNNSWYIF